MGEVDAVPVVPEPGRWLIDGFRDRLHWVEPGRPRDLIEQPAQSRATAIFEAVCSEGAVLPPSRRHTAWQLFERCVECETWLREYRPCPQCRATGRVKVYRRRDHGPTRRVMDDCGMCDGCGYRAP